MSTNSDKALLQMLEINQTSSCLVLDAVQFVMDLKLRAANLAVRHSDQMAFLVHSPVVQVMIYIPTQK